MRFVGWPLAAAVSCALGLTALLMWSPATDQRAGLTLEVDVQRDGRKVLAEAVRASLPTQHALASLRHVALDQPFRATWTGVFHAAADGPYTFTTVSDDGSWVWVDDVLVVDNGGVHGAQRRLGTVRLSRGPHRLRIGYEQHGGDYRLEVRLRAPGGVGARIEAFALQLSPRPLSNRARVLRTLQQHLPVAVVWSWYAVYGVVLLVAGLAVFSRLQALVTRERADWRLGASLAVLAAMAVPGIMWGLPAEDDGWAPDEVSPRTLMLGLGSGFRAPWASLYPPVAYYLWTPLALIMSAADERHGLATWENPGAMHLHLGMRLVSVLMGTGALASTYLIVQQWFGRVEALVAVWMGGLGVCFLYYTKTANVEVPYLYWLMLAFVVFSAFVRTGALKYLKWLALTSALAVCTKDQAAGYVVLMLPALPVIAAWHAGAGSIDTTSLRRALWRREWLDAAALGLAVVIVVYQASWPTLAAHLDVVQAARYSPMVPATLAGYWQLFDVSAGLLAFMVSPPVLACAAVGLTRAVWSRHWLYLVALLVPVASYLIGFLAVIRYTYDRFLLAIALLVACAAAPVVVRVWRADRWRLPSRAAVVVGTAWLVGQAVTVPLLMRHDSRYAVEDHLFDQHDASQVVGLLSAAQYLPRLHEQPTFGFGLVPTLGDVRTVDPYLLLVNTAYAERFTSRPASAAVLQALRDGSLGYQHVMTHRSSLPWWALAWRWSYFHDRSRGGLTNLDKINPEIEVWRRKEGRKGGTKERRDEGNKEGRNERGYGGKLLRTFSKASLAISS